MMFGCIRATNVNGVIILNVIKQDKAEHLYMPVTILMRMRQEYCKLENNFGPQNKC